MSMIGYYFRTNEDTILKMQEGSVGDVVFHEENRASLLDVDKAWHAIHFTLTGSAYGGEEGDILKELVLGGIPISEEDMGYGPARLISKEETAQIAAALKNWDETVFRDNFHIADMVANDIYPVMSDEEDEEFFQYVWEGFKEVRDFFEKAVEEGQCMLTFIA